MAEQKLTIDQFEKQIAARSMKDEAFRKELLANPNAVLSREVQKAFPGAKPLPAHVKIKVVEQTDDTMYLVLPKAIPSANRELRDEELASVAGGCGCTNGLWTSFGDSWW